MKTASLPALVGALLALSPAMCIPAPAATFTLSNSTGTLGTHEVATREVEGLKITYPVDEADVVELLLPTIHEYRAARRASAKKETEGLLEALSEGATREKYRKLLPRLLALPLSDDKTFTAKYDAAIKDVAEFLGKWRQWSGDLGSLNLWNNATGEVFKQGERIVFPEISYEPDAATGNSKFTIRPPYLNQHLGLELFHPPTKASGAGTAVKPFRLDLPLFYDSGESAENLAVKLRELIETLPATLQGNLPDLTTTAVHFLAESLIQAEINAGYFTGAASRTPSGAMLIRALTRYYFIAFLKSSGKITAANEAPMIGQLLRFDLPDDHQARVEFLRAFEKLDPFSEQTSGASAHADYLFLAGSRLVTMTLLKLAQGGDDNGRPIFTKLRDLGRIPPIGFKNVSSFMDALETAYPGKVQETFVTAHTELVTAIKGKLADAVPKAEAPPKPAVEVAPLPDREAQVFDGITITHPTVLRDAIRRLGPELAAQVKQARATVAARFDHKPVPPVPITEATLEMLRKTGLLVTRERADFYASQAALLANSSHLLQRVFEGEAVQIWFKDDLKALLKKGYDVPGFSDDTTAEKVNFTFGISAHRSFGPDKPLSIEAFKEALASQPTPVYPIILKDRSIGDVKDGEAQAALIRKADTVTIPFLKAAETVTPAQLGMPRSELTAGGLLTSAQALFSSVHELVEAELIARVIGSPDRRWFCEGVANLLAMRACDEQFGQTGENSGRKVFESLFDPATLGKRAAEIDLEAWPAAGNKTAQKYDDELTSAHYYFATCVLLAATEGRGDGFLTAWIAKIRETPWNRTNSATIIAAYDKLTGTSLREIMKKTSAPSP